MGFLSQRRQVVPNVAEAEGAANAGVEGEAVVVYADPLTTQQMLYHPAESGKGKKHGRFPTFLGYHSQCIPQW